MRRNRGGFTILEVMIFLAISGAMLAAAMAAVNGQQNRTEFTLAMRDIDSKLQDTLNDVSNGNFSYSNQGCDISGAGRPYLTGVSAGIGTNQACLFLGEAIQFSTSGATGGVDNNSRFAVYTVLGRRLKPGTLGNQISVNSFNEANPTTIPSLTSYYDFQNGITAGKIYYTPATPLGASQTTGKYSLLGIYTSFTSAAGNIGNSSADASQSLQAYTYNLLDDGTGFGSGAVNCIDSTNNPSTTCPFDQVLSSTKSKGWGICFDSNNGSGQTALITIYNTSEGVSTRLEFNPDIAVGGRC